MQSGAYGAPLAGGAFDILSFLKRPQTIVRILSWIFSIVVFGTISAEGYWNPVQLYLGKCMFHTNDDACNFGMAMGVLSFFACVSFLIVDAYFPNISSATERKRLVTGDLGFSAVWTFMWLSCFCVLATLWSKTDSEIVIVSAGRAVLAFTFFSIFTWGILTYFAYTRYIQGVSEFNQDYTDPAPDHTSPYPQGPYGNTSVPAGYQQSPFSNNQGKPGEYQPPSY